MPYRVLEEFANLFVGKKYLHRNSALGDFVAIHVFEDLYSLGHSSVFVERVANARCVANRANRRTGVNARRPDGTLGEIVPGETAEKVDDFAVLRGEVATIELGVEVKILAKAMIKQIDRVIGDLQKQIAQFRLRGGADCICVGLVGINHAPYTVGYEGDRAFKTDGRANRHPMQEAAEAERRLVEQVRPHYDELVILRYVATNDEPFDFRWDDQAQLEREYGAALVRIAREYDRRFRR